MPDISSLPASWRQKIREEQPNSSTWTEELKALLDPNIQARPLNLPGLGEIEPKTSEYAFHWVRRRLGNNPDTTRYLQLRAMGYTNATLEDVNPLVNTVNQTPDGTEITRGIDNILMKAPKAIHYGAMKLHHQRSIAMTNHRSNEARKAMMRSGDFNATDEGALTLSRTSNLSEEEIDTSVTRATSENSVQQGTPQWDKIVADGKKAKK